MKDAGIDIENIKRFKLNKNNRFILDSFTRNEIEYSYSKANPEEHLCGFFCAKEALLKTIENGSYLLKDIEITHLKSGKPVIKILKTNKYKFMLSMSHTKEYGCAIVIML